MNKDSHFSRGRIEQAAKQSDVVERARAASIGGSATAGRDVLLGHGAGSMRMDTIGSVTDKL